MKAKHYSRPGCHFYTYSIASITPQFSQLLLAYTRLPSSSSKRFQFIGSRDEMVQNVKHTNMYISTVPPPHPRKKFLTAVYLDLQQNNPPKQFTSRFLILTLCTAHTAQQSSPLCSTSPSLTLQISAQLTSPSKPPFTMYTWPASALKILYTPCSNATISSSLLHGANIKTSLISPTTRFLDKRTHTATYDVRPVRFVLFGKS